MVANTTGTTIFNRRRRYVGLAIRNIPGIHAPASTMKFAGGI